MQLALFVPNLKEILTSIVLFESLINYLKDNGCKEKDLADDTAILHSHKI